MKCLICGHKTESRILCSRDASVDNRLRYLTVHKCGSFVPKEKNSRVCKHNLLCEPIKRALKYEPLIDRNLGHVICPYPLENLSYVVYHEFDEEDIRVNYPECLD